MISQLKAIIFDFDGVLTDDRVYVDQEGRESVCCSRSDGLGFDILRKTGIKLFILSTETNPVVAMRGEKIKVPVIQGTRNKSESLQNLAANKSFPLDQTLFVGNDVNDLPAMRLCGYSACPADAHPLVRKQATYVLARAGGHGVVREIVEEILKIDILKAWHPPGHPLE